MTDAADKPHGQNDSPPPNDAGEAGSGATADETKAPPPGPPPAPAYRPASPEPPSSRLGCGGCLLIAAIGLGAAWLLWGKPDRPDPRRLFPDDTVLYVECQDLSQLSATFAQLPLWKKDQGPTAEKKLRHYIVMRLTQALGDLRLLDVEDLTQKIQGLALALAPVRGDQLGWLLQLNVDNPDETLRFIRTDMKLKIERVTIDNTEVDWVILAGNKKLFLLPVGSSIVVTSHEDLMEFVVEARAGQRQSLARQPEFSPPREAALLWGTAKLDRLRKHFPKLNALCARKLGATSEAAITFFRLMNQEGQPRLDVKVVCRNPPKNVLAKDNLALSQWLPPEPGWSKLIGPQDNFPVKGRVAGKYGAHFQAKLTVREEAPALPSRGWLAAIFWSALWIVIWIVGIIVGLILLLVIITLILALYFYVTAWWRGELAPSPLPAVSSQSAAADSGEPGKAAPSTAAMPPAPTGAVGATESEMLENQKLREEQQ